METDDFGTAMRVVSRAMTSNGITWALFGGAAVCCYGVDCRIRDVDVLACTTLASVEAAIPDSVLYDYGTCQARVLGGIEIWPAPLVFDTEADRYIVDFDAEMQRRLRVLRVDAVGSELPVLAPEDLLLIKALQQRGPESGKHDFEDLRQLWAAQSSKLDRGYIRQRAWLANGVDRVAGALREAVGVSI